jgi:exonuclease VII small subunit
MTEQQPTPQGKLDDLVEELEHTAIRLRSGELDSDEAASAVERCADLASQLGSELDAQARAVASDEPPGQERLL